MPIPTMPSAKKQVKEKGWFKWREAMTKKTEKAWLKRHKREGGKWRRGGWEEGEERGGEREGGEGEREHSWKQQKQPGESRFQLSRGVSQQPELPRNSTLRFQAMSLSGMASVFCRLYSPSHS